MKSFIWATIATIGHRVDRMLFGMLKRQGLLLACSDAPDYSGLNQAALQNAEIGRELASIGREQLAKAEQRQAVFDPKFMELINQSIASQKQQTERSDEQWAQYLKIGKPAEERLAKTAAEYDTPERRAAAMEEARAGVAREGAMQRQAQQQALGRAGISLSSGRALTLDNASRLAEAKAAAGAAGAARDRVEATGMSLTDNVAKFGRGMTSSGLQAAGLALGAGGQASGQIGQQQGTYNASLSPGLSAFGGSTSATGSAGSLFGQMAGLQQQANQSSLAGLGGLGSLMGTLGGAGKDSVIGSMIFSSREFKEELGEVDPEEALAAVRKPKVKRWRYLGDDREEVGPMAEDVHEATGLGDGRTLSVVTELGMLRGAVQALADRQEGRAVPKRRSLADVETVPYKEVA